jgi:rare lipoprotein A
MTAAHKTLPLPTRVRVTNLTNGRSVIVRVNDRGPFVDNRVIDLSFAAARKLGMVRDGTAMVEVTALPERGAVSTTTVAATSQPDRPARRAASVYLQVGAFGDHGNAQQLRRELEAGGLANTVIHFDNAESPALYRVRLGPIADVSEYDQLLQRVTELRILETHLVTEIEPGDVVTRESPGI